MYVRVAPSHVYADWCGEPPSDPVVDLLFLRGADDVLKIHWKGCQPDETTRIFGEKQVDPHLSWQWQYSK